MATQADHNDEHLDRKLDILSKGFRSMCCPLSADPSLIIAVHEDPVDHSSHVLELEAENEALRWRLDTLERELNSRSPTKASRKAPHLTARSRTLNADDEDCGTTLFQLNAMKFSPQRSVGSPIGKTPGKKTRKLTARKWDLMDEDELAAYENCC